MPSSEPNPTPVDEKHDVVKPLDREVVKERILLGNAKRAHMKKGVIRRCIGNARNMVMATCDDSCSIGSKRGSHISCCEHSTC